jgi:F-type H+-transporting ATPase subunit b
MDVLAVATGLGHVLSAATADAENTGLTINLFWVIVAAVNFVIFLGLIWAIFFKPVTSILETRRARIEQGLKDADEARREREAAADQRQAVLAESRREAADILARAQKLADETHQRELAETRAELERLRSEAVAEIDGERQRALNEVRAQVADLALQAAGKVVGETMTGPRERRLVEEFLAEVAATPPSGGDRN